MKELLDQIIDGRNFFKHLRTAIFVGIILNLINQWNPIMNVDLHGIDFFKLIMTFFVPFSVSVYSAATINKIKNNI
jgi:hypothetical protein